MIFHHSKVSILIWTGIDNSSKWYDFSKRWFFPSFDSSQKWIFTEMTVSRDDFSRDDFSMDDFTRNDFSKRWLFQVLTISRDDFSKFWQFPKMTFPWMTFPRDDFSKFGLFPEMTFHRSTVSRDDFSRVTFPRDDSSKDRLDRCPTYSNLSKSSLFYRPPWIYPTNGMKKEIFSTVTGIFE